jgi:Ca2+-binding EF-hand superfamily protein
MRTVASGLLLSLAFAIGAGERPSAPAAETIDLLLPGEGQRLRLELRVEGRSPTAAWNAFLERWFAWFDRDGDGYLTRAEAARIFPLPLPKRDAATFHFETADADKDGKVTCAEMKAFYVRAGFTPIMTRAVPTSLEDLQIGEALFRHFGPNSSGKLTLPSLRRVGDLMRRLDENEDSVLTAAEVLSLGIDPTLQAPVRSECTWAASGTQPPMATVIVENANHSTVRVKSAGKALINGPADDTAPSNRLRLGNTVLLISASREDRVKGMATTRQFAVAQFKNVAGSKQWLEKRQVEDDASIQLVADLFDHADRDANGKLTLAELEEFLSLVEQGAGCCLVLTLHEAGRNLFNLLDANGDGRLDQKELHTAAALLAEKNGRNDWSRRDIPLCVRVTMGRGVAGGSFGPVPLVALPRSAPFFGAERNSKGPAWFRALDRNGDGLVSQMEFLGPPELFRQLDRDGDGLISVDEAEHAQKVLHDLRN